MLIFCLLPPMSSPCPPTSVLDEKFWTRSNPSLGFVLQFGQSTRVLGGDSLGCDPGMLPRVPKPRCGGVPHAHQA